MMRCKSLMMQIFILAVCVVALSVSSPVLAQQRKRGASNRQPRQAMPKVRFTSGNSALKIPLEMDGNIIFLRVSVNNSKPLKFLLDTGASVSFINESRATELGLKATGQVSGNATGGAIQAALIKGVSLSVPGAQVSNQLMASMSFGGAPVEFDGVIGYDFINQFVVELDYRSGVMNLYSPRTYIYTGQGEIIPLLLKGRRTPLVRTKIIMEGRAPVEARLEVDTGADGTFVINSPYVKKQNLLSSIQKTVQSSGSGAGGEQQRLVGRVKAVQFGRLNIENPTIALSLDTEGSGASEENDGLIGGEIFRRFKVILDYSRRRMILEPNESFRDPFDKTDYERD
jgi:predicted aspartyl protease